MTAVLDASAVLTLLYREPGHDQVAELIGGAVVCTVNWTEIVQKLAQRGHPDPAAAAEGVRSLGVHVLPFTPADAACSGRKLVARVCPSAIAPASPWRRESPRVSRSLPIRRGLASTSRSPCSSSADLRRTPAAQPGERVLVGVHSGPRHGHRWPSQGADRQREPDVASKPPRTAKMEPFAAPRGPVPSTKPPSDPGWFSVPHRGWPVAWSHLLTEVAAPGGRSSGHRWGVSVRRESCGH